MSSAALTADGAALPRPAINPWIIAMAVTLATFMEVLDTSIANVSCRTSPAAFPPAPTRAPGY